MHVYLLHRQRGREKRRLSETMTLEATPRTAIGQTQDGEPLVPQLCTQGSLCVVLAGFTMTDGQ